jgi:transposase
MFNLGVDVSKNTLDLVLLLNTNPLKIKNKTIDNTPAGYALLQQWVTHLLPPEAPWQVVMEATGVYHENLAYTLHQAGIPVSIVNPAQLRKYAQSLAIKSKNDHLDALVIARFGAERHPQHWTPPTAQVSALTQMLARLDVLSNELCREKNRREKAMSTRTTDSVHLSLNQNISFLEQQYKTLKQTIDEQIESDGKLKQDRALLATIPAVGDKTSAYMTIFFNRYHFDSAEQSAAFLGLIPIEHTSGTSVHRHPHLARSGHPRLRSLLYMAALVASVHNPHLRALYQRLLLAGKAKKAALGALMRKLVHICYGVFTHQTPYQPISS